MTYTIVGSAFSQQAGSYHHEEAAPQAAPSLGQLAFGISVARGARLLDEHAASAAATLSITSRCQRAHYCNQGQCCTGRVRNLLAVTDSACS